MMARFHLLFGFLGLRIICGMKDQISVEATSTASGDVPNNGGDILATLPEAPEDSIIEIENGKNS